MKDGDVVTFEDGRRHQHREQPPQVTPVGRQRSRGFGVCGWKAQMCYVHRAGRCAIQIASTLSDWMRMGKPLFEALVPTRRWSRRTAFGHLSAAIRRTA